MPHRGHDSCGGGTMNQQSFECKWDHWPNAGEMVTALANVPHRAVCGFHEKYDYSQHIWQEGDVDEVTFKAWWD